MEIIILNFGERKENLRMEDTNIVISKIGTRSTGLRY